MSFAAPSQFSKQIFENVEVWLKPLETMDARLKPVYVIWNGKRGTRRFPSKQAITPRDIKPFLRHATLIGVVNGGRDFEYRIVGDAHVQAFGRNFQGEKTSAFHSLAALGEVAHGAVASEGKPRLVQYHLKFKDWPLYRRETLFLPLGEDTVDHILAVGVGVPSQSENATGS